jgi:UDP-N-acetylglucosamine acyltransferase
VARVHSTAVVDPRAELAASVEIGPYSVIGPGVRIDEGTRLLAHVVVSGATAIGRNNVIHPFAVIGGDAQVRKSAALPDARPAVAIGDDNVLREHVTLNASTTERPTTIGSKNLLMAGCHVAHDVLLGSSCIVANGVQLAGHVVVEDHVNFGGLSGVAQRLRIGQGAFVAAGAMCERDVPPFVIVQGDRARVRALNVVGLERRAVPPESIAALRRAFAELFVRKERAFASSLAALDRSDPWVRILADAFERPGLA